MSEVEIDLRIVPTSCTSHPVVVLVNLISNLAKENVNKIKIYFNTDDIPINALKSFLSKYNFYIRELQSLDSKTYIALASKYGES